jgi:DNA replication protein DnaC
MMDNTQLLDSYLKALRLPCFLAHYRRFAEDAAQQNLGYDRFLLALAEQEVRQREQNRQIRRIKQARFPVQKELSDFDFSVVPDLNKQQVLQLAQGAYIKNIEPVIMVGNPGLGKTHVATALALCACRAGCKVRFYHAAGLVNEMITAQDEHRLNKFLATALAQQLIVIDELGFIPLSTTGAQLLFQFCSTLYERVALIVTTNLRFADWTQILGDEQLAAALLDRLTHRAHILEFTGESFRFRERMKRIPEGAGKEKKTG